VTILSPLESQYEIEYTDCFTNWSGNSKYRLCGHGLKLKLLAMVAAKFSDKKKQSTELGNGVVRVVCGRMVRGGRKEVILLSDSVHHKTISSMAHHDASSSSSGSTPNSSTPPNPIIIDPSRIPDGANADGSGHGKTQFFFSDLPNLQREQIRMDNEVVYIFCLLFFLLFN
jgi:hypothetical protein